MTSDPIQAAKERLEIDVARILTCQPAITGMEPGLPEPDRWVRDLGGDLASLLAHVARLEGENERLAKAWEVKHKSQTASEKEAKKWFEQGHAAVKRAISSEADLANARRQIEERDEALKLVWRRYGRGACGANIRDDDRPDLAHRAKEDWARIEALLSKGSEEAAGQSDRLPELPSGSPPEAAVGATAALAGDGIQADLDLLGGLVLHLEDGFPLKIGNPLALACALRRTLTFAYPDGDVLPQDTIDRVIGHAWGDDEETIDGALADLQQQFPGAFWVLGYGKTTADEPLFGIRVLFGSDEVLAEGEGDTAVAAIRSALSTEPAVGEKS